MADVQHRHKPASRWRGVVAGFAVLGKVCRRTNCIGHGGQGLLLQVIITRVIVAEAKSWDTICI